MAGTRSSARLASQPKSSPTQPKESPKAAAGSKRKAEAGASPTTKRGRKAAEKAEQKTIEETMDIDQTNGAENDATQDGDPSTPDQKPNHSETDGPEEPASKDQGPSENPEEVLDSKSAEVEENKQSEKSPDTNGDKAEDKAGQPDESQAGPSSKMDDTGKIESTEQHQPQPKQDTTSGISNGSAIQSHARDEDTPSSILEKGIIYFFFRGRTGVDNPTDVNDIARSYMVLRPIPHGAKLGEGTVGDGGGKCRLLALPKKVLPLSGKDKFMTFVEKSKTTFKELRDEFMSASDYETKTAGVRHTPPATPIAEGVYALTTTGRESHLAYMITIPHELGEVQKDIGIREQGSFITSAKNPQYQGPANTNLPQGPNFPKEILDEFRSLRWAPLQPKFLDYENAQFLLIGESSGLERATEPQPSDDKQEKETPKEELEKLEGEDEIRVKDLKGNDAVFADLGISKKDYPQVPSTWGN